MGLRPGQAKGPWVGINAAAADSYQVKVSADDTTPEFLEDKITVGDGLDIVTVDPGGDESLLITLDPSEAPPNQIPAFYDNFYQSKPFWMNTPVLTSGDWTVDTTNHYLSGAAQNNLVDLFKYGIEGEFDYIFDIDRGAATSAGFWIYGKNNAGTTIEVYYKFDNSTFLIGCTGQSAQTPAALSVDRMILWLQRRGTTLRFYAKLTTDTSWTLVHTYTGVDLGYNLSMGLDSATGGKIREVTLYDNVEDHEVKGTASKIIALTDASPITVDAALGDIFTVTLGASRQFQNPTNAVRGKKIIFRVKQDATGSRLVTWDTKYRFSTDLPAPTATTTADKIDYFGFIYHEVDDKWDYIAEVKGF